jgi:hypothetical protein
MFGLLPRFECFIKLDIVWFKITVVAFNIKHLTLDILSKCDKIMWQFCAS